MKPYPPALHEQFPPELYNGLVILVPVDGSDAAAHAMAYAADFAKLAEAELHACYVSDLVIDEGARILAKAQTIAAKRGVDAQTHVLRGHAGEAILELAGDLKADLIAMGTRGCNGLQRLALGSVAEYVTRRSPIPVLLLRDPGLELLSAS